MPDVLVADAMPAGARRDDQVDAHDNKLPWFLWLVQAPRATGPSAGLRDWQARVVLRQPIVAAPPNTAHIRPMRIVTAPIQWNSPDFAES